MRYLGRILSLSICIGAWLGCGTWVKNQSKPSKGAAGAMVAIRLASGGPTETLTVPVLDASGTHVADLAVRRARLLVSALSLKSQDGSGEASLTDAYSIDLDRGAILPEPPALDVGPGAYDRLGLVARDATEAEVQAGEAPEALLVEGDLVTRDHGTRSLRLTVAAAELDGLESKLSAEDVLQIDGTKAVNVAIDLGLDRWFDFADPGRNALGVDPTMLESSTIQLDAVGVGNARRVRDATIANIRAATAFGEDADGDGRLDSAAADQPTASEIAAAPSGVPDLGVGADLQGKTLFPADNAWNRDVSNDPVDPDSDALVAACGRERALVPLFGSDMGIPYLVIDGTKAPVPVAFDLADGSDPGPYRVPLDAPIEDPTDAASSRRVLVVDRAAWRLFELVGAARDGSRWTATAGAVFDLSSNALRPESMYAANAAGLPVLAGLVRRDEVFVRKEIRHALSFSCPRTRNAYTSPATRSKSTDADPSLPVMGLRVRLKAGVDISKFSPAARVVLIALKRYGMLLAENGVSWGINGEPSDDWAAGGVSEALRQIKGSDLEVVEVGDVTTTDP
jgi:hypothetical protein